MAATDKTEGAAAVDRALLIVAAIAQEPAPQTLAEIARSTGYYKSTILRLIASLVAAGYVERRDDRYGLGLMAFRLGLAYERANSLRSIVLPVLKNLVAQGTESASFHVRQSAESRLCLFRVDSGHATRDTVHAGQVLPLRRGAAGRVLLAFGGEPEPAFEAIRSAGFALSLGERDPICAGLACPVLGPEEQARGALSVSGPRERFTEAAVALMLPLLLAAAREVTRPLGGDPGRLRVVDLESTS